jgi:CheY-like chemotaxis protein
MKQAGPYILMLEDDSDDRHITQTIFADNGYDVALEFLTNSEEVLPYLDQCRTENKLLPRLILLDKNVPASGGMEVLKNIKSHPVYKTIPVVMISGTAFTHEVNESYKLGVNSFIVKPATHDLTVKTIGNFINYWFGSVELPEIATIPAGIRAQ